MAGTPASGSSQGICCWQPWQTTCIPPPSVLQNVACKNISWSMTLVWGLSLVHCSWASSRNKSMSTALSISCMGLLLLSRSPFRPLESFSLLHPYLVTNNSMITVGKVKQVNGHSKQYRHDHTPLKSLYHNNA